MGICDLLRHEEEAKKENKIAKARKISKCSSFTPVSLKVAQQEPATASKWAMKLTKARAMRVISIHFMAWPLEDERGEAGQVALDRKGCFVNAVICCRLIGGCKLQRLEASINYQAVVYNEPNDSLHGEVPKVARKGSQRCNSISLLQIDAGIQSKAL